MPRPTYLRFYLELNDDQELSCLFCMLPGCEQRFPVAGGGRTSNIGVHDRCADNHNDKLQGPAKDTDEGVG